MDASCTRIGQSGTFFVHDAQAVAGPVENEGGQPARSATLGAVPFDPRRPFVRSDALAIGVTPGRLRGPGFRTVLHGVLVAADVPDSPVLRARAALLVHPPRAVASHFTAARVIGAPVPPDPLEHVTVDDADDRRRRQGVRCHVAALCDADVRLLGDLRITAPNRLFTDLASVLGLLDLVILGDWLVRHGHTTVEGLVAYCANRRGRAADAARAAAGYVRARVDSPMETKLRMLLVLAGLPEPVVNLELRDEYGELVMKIDLSYPEILLAIEYDGRVHLESARQWERDVERQQALGDASWRLIRVTSHGIHRDPAGTVRRVWQALRERGVQVPEPSDAWRAHFPVWGLAG